MYYIVLAEIADDDAPFSPPQPGHRRVTAITVQLLPCCCSTARVARTPKMGMAWMGSRGTCAPGFGQLPVTLQPAQTVWQQIMVIG